MRFVGKDLPEWLAPGKEDNACPGYVRSIRYHRQVWLATPSWLTDQQKQEMKVIYDRARELRRYGRDVHVDHIAPLKNDLVCGLHVPWNLQILEGKENLRKGNSVWPDHPFENLELALPCRVHHQMRLPL